MESEIKLKKPVRSGSGVTPLTVVLKPRKCNHGTCIYCPGGDYVPQSYTDKSPAIMRALTFDFDVRKQVQSRLDALIRMGHPTEKIELIIIGGTFLQYPFNYQYDYVKGCYEVLNGVESKDLKEAQKINETAKHRVVAMCIENRPDNCSVEEIRLMRDFGATRVEIGVQILDNEIYKKTGRGHTIKEVIEASQRLKDAGFKVGYHIMPGLPYSNVKKDIEKFKIRFGKITIGRPEITEADGSKRPIFPSEARLRKISYAAPINLEISSYINDIQRESFTTVVGRLPIMLRSKYCNPWNLVHYFFAQTIRF